MKFNGMHICPNCFREQSFGGVCPHCGYQGEVRPPLALPEGTVLGGHYLLGRVLGQGGFGITYAAWDFSQNRKVAVKEYFPETFATRESATRRVTPLSHSHDENYRFGLQQFLKEAGALSQFTHIEEIVSVYACFEENGTAYFTMEFLEGITFKEYISRFGGRVPWQETCNVLFPVMTALDAVHQSGMVHRDVAPDNIFITQAGKIKLLDFGAARYSLGDKSATLDVVLKHGFAPMEQYTAHGRRGPYTDIYALGACFYMALTGQVPPNALDRVNEDTLVPPEQLGVSLPAEARNAILKALEVRSAQRQQTITQLRSELLSQKTVPINNSGTPGSKGLIRGLIAAVIVLALALAAVLIIPNLDLDSGGRVAKPTEPRETEPKSTEPRETESKPTELREPEQLPTVPPETLPEKPTEPPLLEMGWLGGIYVGQAGDGDIPQGEGKITWDCGSWEGNFDAGYPLGEGTFTTAEGEIIRGQWRWGTVTLTHARGMARSLRAGSYEGLLLDEIPNGYGKADFDLAGTYTGGFRSGNPKGLGAYRRRDGGELYGSWSWLDRQEGSFLPEKKGSTTYYTGMFLDGSYQGFGCLDFDSCGSFYGEFRRGEISGSGAYYYRCPETHVYLTGDNWEFVYGDYRYENTYYGMKLNGTWHGFGIGVLKSGNHYAGELLNDFRDGYGRVFLQNSTVDPNLCGIFREGGFVRKLN